jgi:phage baseplate assembly protein gpV
MSHDVFWQRLIDRITHLERLVVRQNMRINNMIREAKVLEVDPSNGTAVVDAHGIVTKGVPWLQQAGDIVDWEPPSQGQRMMLFSPGGEIARGFLLPGGFTDAAPQPYDQGAMFGRSIGGTKISGSANGYNIETSTFTIKGNVVITGNVDISGANLMHNGKNVGSTHTHTNVEPGPAQTGAPA